MTCVLIIGAGLVGSSLGLALTRAGMDVHLEDRSKSHARVAAGMGAGQITTPGADEVDVVVVATPPATIAGVVAEALVRFPRAVVTDVGSVKAAIVADVAASSDDAARYVPSHPMAGSQFSGPLTATADLFQERTWVVTPTPANATEHVETVRDLAALTGARVVELSPEAHDEAVAQVSHVPHLMSILTASHLREVPGEHLRLAGQGIRDVTRIAGSDTAMWRQIINTNAAAVREELEEVADDLAYLISVLDQPELLEECLRIGQSGARSLTGKHGRAPKDVVEVTVEIPDEPRALARLFGDVGEIGFNVEDFDLSHDAVREVGYLSISVAQSKGDQLRADLTDRGWNAWSNQMEAHMSGPMVIAIDGPSGSGKSTTARLLAQRLGLAYLDTGAMYRAIAWQYLRSGLPATDTEGIRALAVATDLRIATIPDQPRLSVDGEVITEAIREPRISENVSVVAAIPEVRKFLIRKMREIIAAHGRRIVVEGRDITTVVAPDAQVRVLLVADPEARVARRKAELGEKVDQDAVNDQVIRRDRDDSRVTNFTEAAEGVTVIDSTHIGPDEVVERIVALTRQ
ncbi:hypothetical protein GCM10028820_11460 [Tessaracoccus terricola]